MKLIENYSERAIVVIGDTKPIKDQLKAIGGKFNPFLKHEGLTVAGWVFSKNRINEVKGLIFPGVNCQVISRETEKTEEPESEEVEYKPEQICENAKYDPNQDAFICECSECYERGTCTIEDKKEESKPEPCQPEPVKMGEFVRYNKETGPNVINTYIMEGADLSYKEPEKMKDEPFIAIFSGYFNGQKEFKSVTGLQKYLKELNKGRRDESLKVEFKKI